MSTRSPDILDAEDLSVQVRRGQASRADERALTRALERDPALQVAHQVGVDIDRAGAVRAGDEDLILRAAEAALAATAGVAAAGGGARRAPASRGIWRVLRVLQVAAAVTLVSFSGVAAALWVAGVNPPVIAWITGTKSSVPEKPRAKHALKSQVQAPASPAALDSSPTLVLPPPLAAAPPDPADEPNREATREQLSHHAHHLHDGGDAAELFHSANAARRAGELKHAERLYGELMTAQPDSDEAHVAHVALGKLLLSQGHARAAEREFQRYLGAGGGPLSEEALFSRAQALARLGRASEERSAWTTLLASYPNSVYAAQARERLAAKSGPAVAP